MNKLILENTLKDIEMVKAKLVKKILYDFLRHVRFLEFYKVIFDPDGYTIKKLRKYFRFKEKDNKIYYSYDDITIKMIIIDLLLSLPFEMHETRKRFRKYKNKFGFLCNQEEQVIHKIWKLDAQVIVDKIFYKDLSNLIMTYL